MQAFYLRLTLKKFLGFSTYWENDEILSGDDKLGKVQKGMGVVSPPTAPPPREHELTGGPTISKLGSDRPRRRQNEMRGEDFEGGFKMKVFKKKLMGKV